jgi:hypothetical protein
MVYAYDGSGSVEGRPVAAGAGGPFDHVRKVSFEAKTGTRILLVSAPESSSDVPP